MDATEVHMLYFVWTCHSYKVLGSNTVYICRHWRRTASQGGAGSQARAMLNNGERAHAVYMNDVGSFESEHTDEIKWNNLTKCLNITV